MFSHSVPVVILFLSLFAENCHVRAHFSRRVQVQRGVSVSNGVAVGAKDNSRGKELLEPLRRLQAEASIIALPIVPIVKEPVVQIDGEPSNGKAGVRIATKGGKGKAGTGKASKGKAGGGKAVGTITSSSPRAPPSRAPSPPPSIIPRARPVIAPSPPPTPSPPPSILPSARPVIAPTPPPTNKPAEVISSSSGLESIRGENLLVGADTSSSKRVAAGSLCVVGLLVGFIMP